MNKIMLNRSIYVHQRVSYFINVQYCEVKIAPLTI